MLRMNMVIMDKIIMGEKIKAAHMRLKPVATHMAATPVLVTMVKTQEVIITTKMQ